MGHIDKWDKLDEQYKATGDIEPIRRKWGSLCRELRTAGDNCIEFFNTELDERKVAQSTYDNVRQRMDDFRKKFFL
jgi:hypothetical protein